jgi:YD repeat-containing protein
VGYPTNGVTEFTWWQYDAAGNRIAQAQCSSNATGVIVWATNGWTYDGLNRMVTETSKDGATTTYGYDALGDVTNRAMPGGLTWSATYLKGSVLEK